MDHWAVRRGIDEPYAIWQMRPRLDAF